MSENRATTQKKRFRPGQDIRRIFPLSLCVDLFCTLTILFFSPLEVYYGNIIQFLFSIGEIWWIMAGTAAVAALILTAVKCLFPRRVALILNAVTFGGTLCAYVQAMLLNGKMSSLTGEGNEYDLFTIIGDLAIWVLILAAVVTACVLLIRRGEKGASTVRKTLIFASLTLIVMQLTGFLSNVFTVPTVTSDRYLSTEHRFTLSEKNNTVMFVLDTLDGRYLEEARKEFPDIFDGLDGFTYYPNATCTHSRTYPSVPYLLTGEMCYFDKPYREYIREAYKKSDFLSEIRNTGASIGIYTDKQYVSDKAMELVDNSADYRRHTVAEKQVIRQMTKIALFRDMPYAFKAPFLYDSTAVNKKIVLMENDQSERCTAADDIPFYYRLKENGLTLDSDYPQAMRMYHFWCAHPDSQYDEYVVRPGERKVTIYQNTRGCFRILQEYFREMKRLGVYDRATIIITADHSDSWGTSKAAPLEIDTARPVAMLVKSAGQSTGFTVSDAPVAQTDLFSTIWESFGIDADRAEQEYGRPITSYRPGEKRQRYYYQTALYYDTDGEVALREYLVDGDARDLKSYHLTGRNWDVLYSERAVSKHRLSDVLTK